MMEKVSLPFPPRRRGAPAPIAVRDEAYASSLEHVLDELARIDLLVRIQVARARAGSDDPLRGLSISDAEIDALLGRSLGQPHWASVPLPPALADAYALVAEHAGAIERRRVESLRRGVPLRLSRLATSFQLTRFDLDVLVLALAPEIDLRYERLFAYLNDDVTRRRPTVDAVLSLLCPSLEARMAARARFASEAPLIRNGLVHVVADPQGSLLGAVIRIDERIAGHLHDADDLDARLAPHARAVTPAIDLADLLAPDALKARLAALAAGDGQVLYLHGPRGVGKQTAAEACCRAADKRLLVVDGRSITTDDAFDGIARAAVRESVLLDATLYWDGFDALFAADKRGPRAAVLRALEGLRGLAFLAGHAPWDPVTMLRGRAVVHVELGLPDPQERARLWAGSLGDAAASLDLAALAGRYRLSGGQIHDAAATAGGLARFRDPARPEVTLDDLSAASRICSSPKLSTLANKVTARAAWDELVLSRDRVARLREICDHARHRDRVFDGWGFQRKLTTGRGLGVLFAGPPGTGKTMTAGVLAGELGLDLFQIDVARVVDKYVGETEKQLSRLFDEAEGSNAILFFDEADALFGKRTEVHDAHDRYANIEVSYLLQRMDAYEGIIILATNLARNMDQAFVRRLRFIVEFDNPEEHERRELWERAFPERTPRDPALDLAFMARRFELTGGHIRNVVLAAAFLAAAEGSVVMQKHLLHAARREYQKMGKMADESMFAYHR
ncbi:Cell division protein FtsH [Minicystis rosea]|nr:Cell division protein FtsH [Minicystis rosea]